MAGWEHDRPGKFDIDHIDPNLLGEYLCKPNYDYVGFVYNNNSQSQLSHKYSSNYMSPSLSPSVIFSI